VVFVATDASNVEIKSWTQSLTFTNDPGTQTASAAFSLTNVPAGTVNLSAKTAWHLRKRVIGLNMAQNDGQVSASYTLLGGDLDNSNSVNILDYSRLKNVFNTAGPTADINGDGQVNTSDYLIMKTNWFQLGDAK
jgi:hypothetical protein